MAFSRSALSWSFLPQVTLLCAVVTTSALAATGAGSGRGTASLAPSKIAQNALPLVFEENVGQLPKGTLFAGRASGYTVAVRPSALSFAMQGNHAARTIDLNFSGALEGHGTGVSEAAFRTNYFVGSDPSGWHAGVKNFNRVALRELYAGIDAEFYSHANEIEHDFLLGPDADAAQLVMHLSGARAVRLSGTGDLLLEAEDGYLRLHKPVAYQTRDDGTRELVAAEFHLVDRKDAGADVSFALGAYDHSRTLVIDPVITYATYVAGDKGSVPAGIASDTSGNVYLMGTTSSTMTTFGVTATKSYPAAPTPPLTFLAKLAAGTGGSAVTWLTYYGSATAPVRGNVIALPQGVAAPTALYVGGQTLATDLPSAAAAPTSAAGSTLGFVASFATADGTLTKTDYVAGQNALLQTSTAVTALSATGTTVTVGGNTTYGATVPGTTAAATAPTALGTLGQLAETQTGTQQGFVTVLDSTLSTSSYTTYISGNQGGTSATTVTGAVLTGTAASGKLYVAGYTSDNFPKSGMDTGVDGLPLAPAFWAAPAAGHTSGFAARITPSTTTIDYSYWTGSSGSDAVTGLTLDATGNLVVFGKTSGGSGNLATTAATSSTSAAAPTALTALDSAYPTGATVIGFFSKIDTNGGLQVTSYLTSSTSGSTTTVTGSVVDATGNLYFAGSTDGIKAAFPAQTSGTPVAPPLLPAGMAPQDLSVDSTPPSFISRAYLVELPATINSVLGLAYVGPGSMSGTSSGVGLALDASPNAYLLVQDVPSSGNEFTTASAAQMAPQNTGAVPSAYVAQIAFATPSSSPVITGSASFTVSGSMQVPPPLVGYLDASTYSVVTLKYVVVGSGPGGAAASNVVFNLPFDSNFQPYGGSGSTPVMPTVTFSPSAPAGAATVCTLGPAAASAGYTCVVPTLPSGTTVEFDVTAGISSTVAIPGFTVKAAIYDAQGDELDPALTIYTATVPTLKLLSVTTDVSTVNAALNNSDTTTPMTKVTYTYKLQNFSANDSPVTHLVTNLVTGPNVFTPLGFTSDAPAQCDFISHYCDIPPMTTVTYTVTGVYLASAFGGNVSGPFSATHDDATLTFLSPQFPTSEMVTTSAPTPAVSVNGNSVLATLTTTSATTYKGGFRLGDNTVQLITTVANSGTNQASGAVVTVTLPKGFTATASSGTSSAGPICTSPVTTTCTFKDLSGTGSGGAPGTAIFTITGTFNDTGTAADAVAPPATSAAPTASTVAASAVTGSVTTQSTVVAGPGTVSPTQTVTPVNLTVWRVNTLAYSLSATAPLANNTANETNTGDVSDQVVYKGTLVNTGVSVARGIYLTIPIPVSATGVTAVVSNIKATPAAPAINTANDLVCSSDGTNITCYERDLTAVSTGTPATPAALTYIVSFSASFPETSVPLTTVSGMTTASQGSGTFASAADTYTAPATVASAAPTIQVQRSTHVVQSLTFTPNDHAPAGYADQTDINLDEQVPGNAPGVNDTVNVLASTYNTGVNDAAGVGASIPLPPYLLILSAVPSTCKITGVANPVYPFNTGAAGATLSCVPASITTPAGTGAGQLTANGVPCTTVSSACLAVSFPAKFVDSPTSATIVGNNAKATVTLTSSVATGNNVDSGTGLTSSIPAPFGVQRAAHLFQTVSLTRVGAAPAGYADTADLNLDERVSGNAPGVNDTFALTSRTYNSGVNYALNVSLIVPLPAYLEIFSIPTGCVITGAPGTTATQAAPYLTGAAGASLTCSPAAFAPTIPAGVLQPIGAATCSTTSTAQCMYATLNAKFVDAPTMATIVGNNARATVTVPPATVSGTFSDSNTSQTPNSLSFGVQRAAHLLETLAFQRVGGAPPSYADKTDVNLDERITGNAPGVNDTLMVISTTSNTGVNYALNVSVVVPLPAYLEIFSVPSGCVITSAPAATATTSQPFTTSPAGDSLTCTPSAAVLQPLSTATCGTTSTTQCLYGTLNAKFVDATTSATIVGNNATAAVSETATVAGTFSDTNTAQTPNLVAFGVQRAAHLFETLSVARTGSAPAKFADATDINLDEHVSGNTPGTNDTLSLTSATYNSGVNFALNVAVVVKLPAYLEVFSIPTGCVITGSPTATASLAQPYLTGAGGASLTCVPPAFAPTTPAAVLQPSAGATCTTTGSQCLYGTFSAKFVDAASTSTILGGSPTAPVALQPATVTGLYSDANPAQVPNTPAVFTVQRAAHLRLASANAIAPTYTDNSALTLDGTSPMIGQAAFGANAGTRLLTGATVYNCIRYTVTVVNEGPNYTYTPLLNYAITQTPFKTVLNTVGTAPTPGPVNCSVNSGFGATTQPSAPLSLATKTVSFDKTPQTYEIDGYFDTNALGGANSALSAFQTAAFTNLDYKDSNTTGTAANDSIAASTVEVVNTPITNTTAGGFTLTPAGVKQPVSLIFTGVNAPGITASVTSTTAPLASASGGLLPSGSQTQYPPYVGKNIQLYQTGTQPMVYTVTSTALVPNTANPTSVCITGQGGALPDTFVKPERSLLWVLQNPPAGTTYRAMPTVLTLTPTGLAPVTGDITDLVTPSGGAYTALTALTFPQAPQSQPAQLCGSVNGFTKSAPATQTTPTTLVPVVFAVLEPVNFPPYVVGGSALASTQTGKGSTSAQTDIYLQVSASQTHDFNDQDPCYIGGTRKFTCDDNPYLNAFVFGGGNTSTVPELTGPLPLTSLAPETAAAAGTNAKNVLQANFTSTAQAYIAVVDQGTGASKFNLNITGTNPYANFNEGNFLYGNSSSTGIILCDPGAASGSYSYTGTPCSGGVTLSSTQRIIAGGNGYQIGSVGTQSVTVSTTAGSGLIPLPFPTTSYTTEVPANPLSAATPPAPAPAVAFVTPGQTAGFVWNWLNGVVQQNTATPPTPPTATYQLACIAVTSLTDATPVKLPNGSTCTISTSNPNASSPQSFSSSPVNYAPTIFITTTGNLFVKNSSPFGRAIAGGISLALCLPLLLFRRRFRRGMVVAVTILSLAAAPLLIGCGSGMNTAFSTANATPAGTYFFQVTATSTATPAATPTVVYSAVFEVVVQPAN